MGAVSTTEVDLLRSEIAELRQQLAERDFGQRHEAELRTVLDNVPVIVSVLDAEGRFRRVNHKFRETFRQESSTVLGHGLLDVVGEPHFSIAQPFLQQALRGETVEFQSVIRDGQGRLRDVRCCYVPQRDAAGELDGLVAMVEDITEQKRSQEALRESELRFRSFFEMAGAGMALVGVTDRRFLRVNGKMAEILDYTRDELLALSFLEVTHPDDVEMSRTLYQRLMQGLSSPYQVEKRYLRKDGALVWGQTSVSVVRDPDGEPLYGVAVVEDITDRKLSETALRESENRLRVLAESLPQLVWTCLPNGNCDYLSAQWVTYTGIPEREQLGLSWLDLVMHPEDRDRTYGAWMAAVRGEAAYDIEYRLRRRDGEYRWFKTRGTPVRDSTGEIVRWFGTCTDIHDRREAEEERRKLLEGEQRARAMAELLNRVGPMLLSELDSQRLVQTMTDLATQLVGAGFGAYFHNVVSEDAESYSLYTLSGAPREAFEKFPMPRNTAVFGPTFAGEAVVISDDITCDPRYGRNYPHKGMPEGHLPVKSYLAVPVKSRAGEVLGGLFFGHPETGRFYKEHADLVQGVAAQAAIALDNARLFAQAEQSAVALRSSNLELRQANADLEQFAYAAAHDLQEPLRMVTSYTQLLERTLASQLDEKTKTFMGFVVDGASRMSLLLQDLLAYSETSRGSDLNERVSLKRALQQVQRNLESAIAEAGAELSVGDLPIVRGREVHFIQLFQNLVGNGLKYRRRDTALRIEISAEKQTNRWLIRVKDNGIGIDPTYHKQVFGVFRRLHGSEIPGTGIGLAICQRVVERAGGEIWVESEPGRGATFLFTVPTLPEKM